MDGLIYAQTPSGQEVLAAAMYVLPRRSASRPCRSGPWCSGTSAPRSADHSRVRPDVLNITGVTPCGADSVQRPTPYLTMVWQIPVAGGPTAIQPPDIQIVEAAVMAGAA